MRTLESPLWGRLGEAEAALLNQVRSRRNRRESYRRMLEDALFLQQLYEPEETPVEHVIDQDLQREILQWLQAVSPRIPFGIPTRQIIPRDEETLEIILLDLRGQAPPRALAALTRAAEDLQQARQVLGLAVVHGTSAQTDMLQLTIHRWLNSQGRAAHLQAAPSSNGTILAFDTQRLGALTPAAAPPVPLALEVATLRELLTISGGNPDQVRVPSATGGFYMNDDTERPKKKRRHRGRGSRHGR